MKKMVLAGAMVATMGMAQAAEWYFIGGNSEVAAFYDKNTVFKKNGQASVWVRKVYKTPIAGQIKVAVVRLQFACGKDSFQVGSLQAFTKTQLPYGTPMDFNESYLETVKVDHETTDQVAYEIGCDGFKSEGPGPFADTGATGFADFWFDRQKQ